MAKVKPEDFKVEDFYFFKIKKMWAFFWSEHPAFWAICGFLFFEYFRPQAIYTAIDFIPWSQLFLALSLGFSFVDKKSKLRWSLTHTLIVLFTIQIYISFIFAYNPDVSWSKNIQFLQWVVVFFLVTTIVQTRERFYVFLMILFICSLKISIGTSRTYAMRGFSFTKWGLMGPSGYFQNSGELSIQMLVLVALGICLIMRMWPYSGRLEKLLLVLGVVTPVLTIIGASSRGSQLALALLLAVFFYKKVFRPKVLVAAILVVVAINYVLPEEQKDRFRSMGDDTTSTQRILYWKNGWEMMKDYPFTGVGFFNFPVYFTDFYPQDILFRNHQGRLRAELPHNIFIQVGTDAGFPALLWFILLPLSVLRFRGKSEIDHSIHRGLLMGILGFCVAGQFVSVAYYPFMWVSVSMLAALRTTHKISKSQPALESNTVEDAQGRNI
ncbi:O-antigen ligase family protein [Reinekea marinisedimentorum]|uniref:O-antigen ligase n=1 Tax=Reinekea marinisedimentorum TaxID=230495 RepID=A0A4R3IE11_9GAMM|nr:O-antigen ligase family protein [Reinekea marinisedimentorum]TCS44114.1 O-antigen ligase [Reinekea marinisedimentorum]